MSDCVFFVPLRKVDEEQRLVYGLVSEEIVDQQDEIFDYDSSKTFFEEWSGRISKATDGASLGNLRLMHQPVVAGKLIELNFDDEAKQISCVAKVVDDHSWKLVLEGCLTGFSLGGKYIRRWAEPGKKGVRRFTVKPVEVSVVDNPAVQTATFEFKKSDGTTELRKFHSGEQNMGPTQEQIAARAADLAQKAGTPDAVDQFIDEAKVLLEGEMEIAALGKAAGGEGGGGDVEGAAAGVAPEGGEGAGGGEGEAGKAAGPGEGTAAAPAPGAPETPPADPPLDGAARKALRKSLGAALKQVWQSPDGRIFGTKDAALDALEVEKPKEETAVEKALRLAHEAGKSAEPGEGDEEVTAADLSDVGDQLAVMHEGMKAAEEHLVPCLKGLYEVRTLTSVLQEMSWLVSCVRDEAQREGDGSTVPAQLFAATRALGVALVTMAQEEVAEMLTLLGAGSDWADAKLPIPDGVVEIVELAAAVEMTKANEAVMQKAGARNSKADASKIQTVHDHAVSLGAKCAGADKAATGEGADDESPVEKSLRADNERLSGEVEKAVKGIGDLAAELTKMAAEIQALKKRPEPLPPRSDHIVIERGGVSEKITQADLEKMAPDERADLAIRLSQLHPVHVGG